MIDTVSRYKIESYKPFEEIENYYIMYDKKEKKKFLLYNNEESNISYNLELKENGFIPKSGLLVCDVLQDICKGKEILDLGTGQIGILSMHSLIHGAKEVDATDIDDCCINWLRSIVERYNIKGINVYKSNFCSNVPDKKYDIIVSNPPQMPMKNGEMHDSGGLDGRMHILNIIQNAKRYLKDGGTLILLMFSFLGVDTSYNDQKSIQAILYENGYRNMQIIKRTLKPVIKGSVTFESLKYIKEVYPNYTFLEEDDIIYNEIDIIKVEY